MSDTDPRCPCPFCGVALSWGRPRFKLVCFNPDCEAILSLVGESRADCIRQATTMKFVDRKVGEAVEAAAVTAKTTLSNLALMVEDDLGKERFSAAAINVSENILRAR